MHEREWHRKSRNATRLMFRSEYRITRIPQLVIYRFAFPNSMSSYTDRIVAIDEKFSSGDETKWPKSPYRLDSLRDTLIRNIYRLRGNFDLKYDVF